MSNKPVHKCLVETWADNVVQAMNDLREGIEGEDRLTDADAQEALREVTEAYDMLLAAFTRKPRDYANPNHSAMYDAWNQIGSAGHHLWLQTARKP